MLQKLLFAAIATFSITLPAVASHPYTSSAPTLTSEDIAGLSEEPMLVNRDERGSLYRSNGFVSSLTTDENLYVERIYALVRREPGRNTVLTAWKQIDCGRMLQRTSAGSILINGVKTELGSTEWDSFGSSSNYANTCEEAAKSRGINWSWNAAEN